MTVPFSDFSQASAVDSASSAYRRFGKRALDLLAVLLIAPVAVPLVGLILLLTWAEGGKPLYAQRRVGRGGRTFVCWKVRTMIVRGAPLELMKARQRRFYFDQGGSLVKHFGIRAVPATVEQQGRALIITEQPVPLKERAPS